MGTTTYIGDGAFSFCRELKKVTFESNRTTKITIHPDAFYNTNVTEIDIGNNTYMNSNYNLNYISKTACIIGQFIPKDRIRCEVPDDEKPRKTKSSDFYKNTI